MIRAAVIDDDESFCELLRKQMLKINSSLEVDCYGDIYEFTANASAYNIAIIDILLGDDCGIEKAAEITQKYPLLNIIFVSAERDFFQDVYKVDHSYFMVKPVTDSELSEALELCFKNLNEQKFCIKQQSGTNIIDLNRVIYFEGMLKKTIIHYADEPEQIVNVPLKSIENQLINTNFIRTHQSYVINMRYITHMSKSCLKLKGVEIPISRKYASASVMAVSRYLSSSILCCGKKKQKGNISESRP